MEDIGKQGEREELRRNLAQPRSTVGGQRVRSFYDFLHGAWMCEQLFDDGRSVTVPLGISDPEDILGADRAELDLVLAAAPPLLGAEEERAATAVYSDGLRYLLAWSCQECGGFELGIDLLPGQLVGEDDDPELLEREGQLARLLAYRISFAIEASGQCPGCVGRALRAGEHPIQIAEVRQPHVWLDVASEQWMLWMPLDEEGEACLPLDLPATRSFAAARRRAVEMLFSRPGPYDQEGL
jgi:hypothetical protein